MVIDVSPGLIATVTGAILKEVAAGQQQRLDPAYLRLFLDATTRVKIDEKAWQCHRIVRAWANARYRRSARRVTLPWSTGPVEGKINDVKLIGLSMYGRAGLDLLDARIMA